MMRRFSYILALIVIAAFLTGPLGAIDKSKKDPDSTRQTTPVPDQNKNKNKNQNKSQDNTRKTYNDFIDRNNNGIDDRHETKKKVTVPKPDSTKKDNKKEESGKPPQMQF